MEVWRLADQFEVDRVLQSAAERIGRQEFTLGSSPSCAPSTNSNFQTYRLRF